jgi:hypothetical protein
MLGYAPVWNGVCSACGNNVGTSAGCCVLKPLRRPYKCPVCDGAGHVSRPPWVAGDQNTWIASDVATHSCHACSGTGIVWSPDGE